MVKEDFTNILKIFVLQAAISNIISKEFIITIDQVQNVFFIFVDRYVQLLQLSFKKLIDPETKDQIHT